MRLVHDVDAYVLLATGIAAKRRPASLAEVLAAVELTFGAMPGEWKMSEAFHRLSLWGLIIEASGTYSLSPAAQDIMAVPRKKADTETRIAYLKEVLAEYDPEDAHEPTDVTPEQLLGAMKEHRLSAKGAGESMLMPKAKTEVNYKRPGQWRGRAGASKRK